MGCSKTALELLQTVATLPAGLLMSGGRLDKTHLISETKLIGHPHLEEALSMQIATPVHPTQANDHGRCKRALLLTAS